MTAVRRAGATSAATLCGLALALFNAEIFAPEWSHRSGLDLWNLPRAVAQSQNCSQEAALLLARERQLSREIELGEHLCIQVMDGSLSLDAAVTEMYPILCKRDGFPQTAVMNFRVSTLRQAVARYLMVRIARILHDDQKQWTSVQNRLEAEYQLLQN